MKGNNLPFCPLFANRLVLLQGFTFIEPNTCSPSRPCYQHLQKVKHLMCKAGWNYSSDVQHVSFPAIFCSDMFKILNTFSRGGKKIHVKMIHG